MGIPCSSALRSAAIVCLTSVGEAASETRLTKHLHLLLTLSKEDNGMIKTTAPRWTRERSRSTNHRLVACASRVSRTIGLVLAFDSATGSVAWSIEFDRRSAVVVGRSGQVASMFKSTKLRMPCHATPRHGRPRPRPRHGHASSKLKNSKPQEKKIEKGGFKPKKPLEHVPRKKKKADATTRARSQKSTRQR